MILTNEQMILDQHYLDTATRLIKLAQEAARYGNYVSIKLAPFLRQINVEFKKGLVVECSQLVPDFSNRVNQAATEIKKLIEDF